MSLPKSVDSSRRSILRKVSSSKKVSCYFEIDPRQYLAALAQAEGNVTRDKAMVQSAQANMLKDQATIGQVSSQP